MDEKNQQPQPTITPTQPPAAIPPVTPTPPIMPPQPPMSAPTPPISPPSQTAPHSPSPMIIGVIILVLVLVIGGVLILMSRQASPQEGAPERSSDIETQTTNVQPTTAPPAAGEATELDSLDLGNVESEFTDVESDLKQL